MGGGGGRWSAVISERADQYNLLQSSCIKVVPYKKAIAILVGVMG